jgi:hypothetical protein
LAKYMHLIYKEPGDTERDRVIQFSANESAKKIFGAINRASNKRRT